jgi:Calcineurin-like phosphoesterase
MSNPFSFFSRRNFLKASILGVAATSPLSRAMAAVPVTSKLVGTPSANSFTVAISAAAKVSSYIEYGYSKNSVAGKTTAILIPAGSTTNITISGLKVKYALGISKNFASLTQKIVNTATATNNAVFAIQADPHMDENSSADVYRGTLKQIVAASPAFLVDLGDIFMVDKLADKSETNIRGRFELMRGFYKELGSVPLKICLGNHDGELGYSKFNTKSYRKEYFPEQTGELAYYSFTGPDQLHIVLDPFTYTTKNPSTVGWEWTLGKTQYDWLVTTLKNSQERHKFIYIHHLLVGDGTYGFDSNRPGWGKPIHQLLLDYKVGFVFKGHDHLYVKQELDGIIYQTVPQPSHPGEKIDVKQYGYISGKGVGGSGFIKVSTSGPVAQVDFITFDGKVADTYTRSV